MRLIFLEHCLSFPYTFPFRVGGGGTSGSLDSAFSILRFPGFLHLLLLSLIVDRYQKCTRRGRKIQRSLARRLRNNRTRSFRASFHDTHVKRRPIRKAAGSTCNFRRRKNAGTMCTHLQCDSPRGDDTQTPPFLQGLGEHDTKPETTRKVTDYFQISLC